MSAVMFRGSPSMGDHTPTTAIAAGDIVDIGGIARVAHHDIPANTLGSLAFPSGQAGYRVTLAVGAVIAEGAAVTVDPATGLTGGTLHFGYAEKAADQTAGDTHVEVVHSPVAP